MKIIVVGGGEIGSRLTSLLLEKKHDVVLVEKNKDTCQNLADKLNIKVINGDGTMPEVLEEAGIKKTDTLVVATSQDETNLLICLVARDMVKEMAKLKIIARASKEEYKKIFLRIGVDNIVSPETSTIEQLEGIIEPKVSDIGKLYKSMLGLVEFEVTKKSRIKDRLIDKIELPEESLVVAIKRKDSFLIPKDTEKLREGDKVILILKKSVERRIAEMFKEK